jgi:hypothetical protein
MYPCPWTISGLPTGMGTCPCHGTPERLPDTPEDRWPTRRHARRANGRPTAPRPCSASGSTPAPTRREQQHRLLEHVGRQGRPARQVALQRVHVRLRREPPQHAPRGGGEAGGRPVLALEPVLDDLELERADGRQQRRLADRLPHPQALHDALLQSWSSPSRNRLNWAVLSPWMYANTSGRTAGSRRTRSPGPRSACRRSRGRRARRCRSRRRGRPRRPSPAPGRTASSSCSAAPACRLGVGAPISG